MVCQNGECILRKVALYSKLKTEFCMEPYLLRLKISYILYICMLRTSKIRFPVDARWYNYYTQNSIVHASSVGLVLEKNIILLLFVRIVKSRTSEISIFPHIIHHVQINTKFIGCPNAATWMC